VTRKRRREEEEEEEGGSRAARRPARTAARHGGGGRALFLIKTTQREEEEEDFFNHYENDLQRDAHTQSGDTGPCAGHVVIRLGGGTTSNRLAALQRVRLARPSRALGPLNSKNHNERAPRARGRRAGVCTLKRLLY